MTAFARSGMIVDIVQRRIFPGTLQVEQGRIRSITEDMSAQAAGYILPGFIDAHVHIESSMLTPSEFARLAVAHGTVATVSDSHEIANVLGIDGVRYMLANARLVPFHFVFGAPSCVPATQFETAGAALTVRELELLFKEDQLKYLSEMMNFPAVLADDEQVLAKIALAHSLKKPVDGHAPGLRGAAAQKYISAGITTDHECFTFEEALEKAEMGMHIIIREGSAAQNFAALHPLIKMFPDKIMFCSDDKHPHELVEGHINQLVRRAIVEEQHDLMDVLRIACLNPIKHYGLDVGQLRVGDSADFIVVEDLKQFSLLESYITGILVAKEGKSLLASQPAPIVNNFVATAKHPADFAVAASAGPMQVIQVLPGQLVTRQILMPPKIDAGLAVADVSRDLLKLCVVNRYRPAPPAVAFVQNFGLKRGALASSVAHDSHNIIAVGCTDTELCTAVNMLIAHKGGIALVDGSAQQILPLPIAGLMSNDDGYSVARRYAALDLSAKQLGSTLPAPFMTLSFLALLVIPELKLSDLGLFDANAFQLTPLQPPSTQS